MKPSAQVVLGTLIAVLVSGTAFGQVKSDEPGKAVRISARVSDPTDAPVRDVAVILKLAGSTGTTASTKTNEAGEYTFLVPPHRSYELHFECPGFRRAVKFVTADKDTDVGTLVLSVSLDGSHGGLLVEPMEPRGDLSGSGNARQTNAISNHDPQAQGSANVDCVERIEIPRYPPLATQAQIDDSITAFVDLSSDGAVHDIKVTAQSRYRQAKNLFGPPVEKVIRAAQFRSGCAEKPVKLVFHFNLKGQSEEPKLSMSFGYPNVFWIISEAPLFQPEAQARVKSDLALRKQGQGQQQKQSRLWAAISVPQPIFDEGRTEDLQMSFAVVNDGTSTAKPNVESSHLFINGVEPQDWSFVIGNGPRNEWFNALPPGKTLQFTYLLGPKYFQKSGIYTVRWESENFKSADLTFRVVPLDENARGVGLIFSN